MLGVKHNAYIFITSLESNQLDGFITFIVYLVSKTQWHSNKLAVN